MLDWSQVGLANLAKEEMASDRCWSGSSRIAKNSQKTARLTEMIALARKIRFHLLSFQLLT